VPGLERRQLAPRLRDCGFDLFGGLLTRPLHRDRLPAFSGYTSSSAIAYRARYAAKLEEYLSGEAAEVVPLPTGAQTAEAASLSGTG
jgi:hypothetical protein